MASIPADVSTPQAVMVSEGFWRQHGAELQRVVGSRLGIHIFPNQQAQPDIPLDEVVCAFWSVDAFENAHWETPLANASNLRWLHVFTAGSDHPLLGSLQSRGVQISTSAGANAKAVAHSALAAVLGFARRMPRYAKDQREHRWRHLAPEAPPELGTTTATILGLGSIGLEIARLCQAFGIHTIGVRRQARPTEYCDEICASAKLHEVLPRTDWLIVACPLTPQTDGWIDAAALNLLPPHAYVINIARGRVIVEEDLINALRRQTIAGAYCDVFETEPLPDDSPLWDLPNVLVSPHSAGVSQAFAPNGAKQFLANLQRWLDHQPLLNLAPGRDAME